MHEETSRASLSMMIPRDQTVSSWCTASLPCDRPGGVPLGDDARTDCIPSAGYGYRTSAQDDVKTQISLIRAEQPGGWRQEESRARGQEAVPAGPEGKAVFSRVPGGGARGSSGGSQAFSMVIWSSVT